MLLEEGRKCVDGFDLHMITRRPTALQYMRLLYDTMSIYYNGVHQVSSIPTPQSLPKCNYLHSSSIT